MADQLRSLLKKHYRDCELLRGQARAASYPTDCRVVDFFRPPLLGLTSGR